jgi:GT2 family glycosyltransferase
MSEKIPVSIIIVNYNSFGLLQKCIESIKFYCQEIDYEVIVVDNNSTEGSVENITNKFNDIILIKNEANEGFSKANNQAAKVARGKYLLLLNNDTVFVENSLLKLLEYSESLPGDFIISCKLLNEDGSVQDSTYYFPSIVRLIGATFFLDQVFTSAIFFSKHDKIIRAVSNPVEVDAVMGALMLIPNVTYELLEGLDERFFFYYEDVDLCYRLKKNGGKIVYIPQTSVYHLGGASAEKNLWFTMFNRTTSRIQFAQKHFSGIYKITFIWVEQFGKLFKIFSFAIMGILTFNKTYLIKAFYNLKLLFKYPQNKFE